MFRNSVQVSNKSNCLDFDFINQTSIMRFSEVHQDFNETDIEEIKNFKGIMNMVKDVRSYLSLIHI